MGKFYEIQVSAPIYTLSLARGRARWRTAVPGCVLSSRAERPDRNAAARKAGNTPWAPAKEVGGPWLRAGLGG